MRLVCCLVVLTASLVRAEPLDEWKPYAQTGLFPKESTLWLAPDMEKEPMVAYTARLLDGARASDARAMATLGRFFFVRGDRERAREWLGKAAYAGHEGAQFDYGVMHQRGLGVPADLVEAYAWLWLATRGGAPGAEEALRQVSAQISMGQLIGAMKLVEVFQSRR